MKISRYYFNFFFILGKHDECSGDSSNRKRKAEDLEESDKRGDSIMNKNKNHQNISNPQMRLRERIKSKGGYEFNLQEYKGIYFSSPK